MLTALGSVIVAVLPEPGSNVRPAAPASCVYDELLVLPSTAIVWVRVPQAELGGSFSTSRLTLWLLPRSTVIDCGHALFALSQ